VAPPDRGEAHALFRLFGFRRFGRLCFGRLVSAGLVSAGLASAGLVSAGLRGVLNNIKAGLLQCGY